jgi:hypothetical protein
MEMRMMASCTGTVGRGQRENGGVVHVHVCVCVRESEAGRPSALGTLLQPAARTVALPVEEVVGLAAQPGRDIGAAQDVERAPLRIQHAAKGASPAVLGAIPRAQALRGGRLFHSHSVARGGILHPVAVRASSCAEDGVLLPVRAQVAVRDPKRLQGASGINAAMSRAQDQQGEKEQGQRTHTHSLLEENGKKISYFQIHSSIYYDFSKRKRKTQVQGVRAFSPAATVCITPHEFGIEASPLALLVPLLSPSTAPAAQCSEPRAALLLLPAPPLFLPPAPLLH